jgi:hypothetical protein
MMAQTRLVKSKYVFVEIKHFSSEVPARQADVN